MVSVSSRNFPGLALVLVFNAYRDARQCPLPCSRHTQVTIASVCSFWRVSGTDADSLVGQFGRISDGGSYGLRRQGRIAGDDLLDALAVRQVVQDDRDHDPRALDARSAVAYLWVRCDVIRPAHAYKLPETPCGVKRSQRGRPRATDSSAYYLTFIGVYQRSSAVEKQLSVVGCQFSVGSYLLRSSLPLRPGGSA